MAFLSKDLDIDIENNFKILDIPQSRAKFTVPLIKIEALLNEHNISVEDESENGLIQFRRYCDMGPMGKKLILALMHEYEKQYPCIEFVNTPFVEPLTTLPADFDTYSLKSIDMQKTFLRRSKGSFRAIFDTNTRDKRITFRFALDAYVTAFKAKRNLDNDKILNANDYESQRVKVDMLPSRIISCQMPKNLITTSYVRKDSYIRSSRVETKKDVLRGGKLRAYIKDGMLVIDIEAEALEDGNVHEVIRIRANNGKYFQAKIISKHEAIIIQ